MVAVVGRPNVGKSTLVNRILGRREAVVQDLPGVTRDRVSYDALWTGRRFVVQDTGGWEPDAKGLQQLVAEQAAVAMRTADAIILVVDADRWCDVRRRGRRADPARSGKPVFLAANKIDGETGRIRRRRTVVDGTGGAAIPSARCTVAGWPTCSTRVIDALPVVSELPPAAVVVHVGWRWSANPTSARARC